MLVSTTDCTESQLKELFGVLIVFTNKHSVFGETLFLEVMERGEKLCDEIANYIKEKEGECGNVYAVLPSDVSKIHTELLQNGISCVKYHGQLSEEVKSVSSVVFSKISDQHPCHFHRSCKPCVIEELGLFTCLLTS